MTIELIEGIRIPYYEKQILSGEPDQLNDWARDLVSSLQEWADTITSVTNQQLNASNSDAVYWGSIGSDGDWLDGTWRLIKINDDDFQLQKKVDGAFTKNANWKNDD
jgi:hypothetical protein